MDRRVARTHAAIKMAFEEMVLENSAHGITVSALAERANINRKTFYLHYDGLDDLWTSYIDEISDNLTERLETHPIKEYLENRGLLLTVFSDFFTENRRFYGYVLTNDAYSASARRVQRRASTMMAKSIRNKLHYTDDEAFMIATFIVTNMVTMLRMQLTGETHFDIEVMRKHIVRLTVEGLNGMGIKIAD